MTLWALVQGWPCDYASIERPRGRTQEPTRVTKHIRHEAPTTISVHLENCRKCAIMRELLSVDERLKTFAERSYAQFVEAFREQGAEDMSAAEFQAIKEHAQMVREEMLGTAKAAV